MRRILIIAAAVLGVLVVVAVVLPFVVPVDAYRGQIEQQASAATGRQLKIDGALRLSVFPTLGVKAEKVTLANVPGGHAPYFATMESLGVGVKLFPLLSGTIAVSEVTLDQPVINLEVDKTGKGNWALGATNTKAAAAPAQGGGGMGAASKASFHGVTIKDGRITYRSDQTGKHRSFDAINVTVAITSLAKPISVDGSLTSDGQKISMDGTVSDPQALMNGAATPVDLSITSDLLQASFNGTLAGGGTANGQLKLDTPSVRKLAGWAGLALPTGGGLGHLSLEGHIAAKGTRDDFSAIRLVLDGQTLTGALAVDRAGTIPFLSGALNVDHLNLNPYMASASAGGGGKPAAPPPAAGQGWSRAPIDFSALRMMNAKLTLGAGAIQMKSIKLGKTALALTLDSGTLAADLNPVTLYGGAGQATLKVDARGATPTIAETARFDNLAMRSFLADAIGVDRIEGTGMLTMDITGAGDSTNAIMHSLAGKGAILFKNGRIHGVDLAGVAQTIRTALSGSATGSGASTSFTEMGGTFAIAKGVMTNKDFHLLSPLFRMTGAGNIDLGNQTIDFVVNPKAVASLQGQGGTQNAAGFGVPFHITGSWSHLHYSPDLSGVAGDILQSVMKGGVSSKSVLQGLFGGASQQNGQQGNPQNPQQQQQQQQQQQKKKKPNPLDAIQNLFGH